MLRRSIQGPLAVEFERLRSEVALQLERWVCLAIIGAALLVEGAFAYGISSGMHVPPKVVFVPLAFVAWYGWVILALRRGWYRPWLRFVSVALDVSMASVVMLVDFEARGAAFAYAAGGPSLFFVAVAVSMLRLDPFLALFAGLVAAGQFAAVCLFALAPHLSGEVGRALGAEAWVIIARSIFLAFTGVLGLVVTNSLRSAVFRAAATTLERERVRGLFGVYMSEQVVEHILEGGVAEGGERRTVTVLVSDVRDFTSLSEARPPEQVVALLNAYFDRMCTVVSVHGGVVNKFLGDGMLVVFGAPDSIEDDAGRALAAAEEMLVEARRLDADGVFPGLRIGVGLHRGEVVAGNVGGSQRQEYTVIGDTVNTASRVEGLCKKVDRPLLVTQAVVDALPGRAFEPLGVHAVKGRAAELALFAPAASPGAQVAAS